jgi:hypothetical protein
LGDALAFVNQLTAPPPALEDDASSSAMGDDGGQGIWKVGPQLPGSCPAPADAAADAGSPLLLAGLLLPMVGVVVAVAVNPLLGSIPALQGAPMEEPPPVMEQMGPVTLRAPQRWGAPRA